MDDTPADDLPLRFDEFDLPTADEWQAAAVASLAGKPFDKLTARSYEGIAIRPLYHREDVASLDAARTLPNEMPYLRGRGGLDDMPWSIAQELPGGSPATANRAMRADQFMDSIHLPLDTPTCAGIDPDRAEPALVGFGGVSMATVDDVAELLTVPEWGLLIPGTAMLMRRLAIHCGASALPLLSLLAAQQQRGGGSLGFLNGHVAADPIGVLAQKGSLAISLEQAYDEMAALAYWAAIKLPTLATVLVDTAPYHDAGANAVQELAFGLATGVAYLRAMIERNIDINIAAAKIQFDFAIGGQFFMEIAKLRAARLLWAQVVTTFGGDDYFAALHIHARTARRNKSAVDPHINILRATTEALAAVIGGVESICVAPFDEPVGPPDDFSRRIARNVQVILQEEANLVSRMTLTQLMDAAGGSYAVETLTNELAQAAWAQFQAIEAQGGMVAALASGSVQSSIAAVAEQRAAALAKRRDVLVGVNQFANPAEKPRPTTAPDGEPVYAARATHVADYRSRRDAAAVAAALEDVAEAKPNKPMTFGDAAVTAASAGATLGEIAAALRRPNEATVTVSPLPKIRLAEPFEVLRAATVALREKAGERATSLFLANLGPARQHKARADFAQSFFEVGGFHVLTNNGFATTDEAAAAALAAGAPAVVICSTDETYPELVPPLVRAIKEKAPDVAVILAGRPAEQIEAHKAAGVDEFIYLGADAVAINRWLLDHIERGRLRGN